MRTIFESIVGPASFGKDVKLGEHDPSSKSAREIPGPGSYAGNYRVMTRNDPKAIIGTA